MRKKRKPDRSEWVERAVMVVIAAMMVAGACIWQVVAPFRSAAECRARYASARTAADSALVDGWVLNTRNGLTCRTYVSRRAARTH